MEKAIEKVKGCLTKDYANFSGRASRSEYWYFALFVFIVVIALTIIDGFMGTLDVKSGHGLLSSIFSLAILIPQLAVQVRRLHDVDKSGWWLLIYLIPIIGVIWMLVLYCIKGTEGENRFGPDPLQV
jgi:uncharacterized membrane protein YhaH (DUF805 family)